MYPVGVAQAGLKTSGSALARKGDSAPPVVYRNPASNSWRFIRAYSTTDGKIIWDYDTAQDYQTVNGIPGKGGALDGGGPVIAASPRGNWITSWPAVSPPA